MATDDRADRALELHLAGATYDAIAQTLGYSNRSGAFHAVKRALGARKPTRDQHEAAQAELMRLDAMLTGLWAKARKGDFGAVDRVLKIGERRMELLEFLRVFPAPQDTPAKVTPLDTFLQRHKEREQRAQRTTRDGDTPAG